MPYQDVIKHLRDVHKVHFDIFKREFKCLLNHGSTETCPLEHSTTDAESLNSPAPPVFPWSAQSSTVNISNEKSPNPLNSNPLNPPDSSTPQSPPESSDLVSSQPAVSNPEITLGEIPSENVEPVQEINIANSIDNGTDADKTSNENAHQSNEENNDGGISPEVNDDEPIEESEKQAFGWQHSSAKNTFPTISLLDNTVNVQTDSTSDIAFGWKHLSAKNYDLPGQNPALDGRYTVTPIITPSRMRPPPPPQHLTPKLRRPAKYTGDYFLSERPDNWPSAEKLAQLNVGSADPALNYDLQMERYQMNPEQEKTLLAIIDNPATILNPKNFYLFRVSIKDAVKHGSHNGGNGVKVIDKYGLTKLDTSGSSNFCPKTPSFNFEEIKTKKPDPKTGQRLHPNDIRQNYKTIYKAHCRFRRSLCNWRLAWLYHIQQHHETDGQVECYHCGIKLGERKVIFLLEIT